MYRLENSPIVLVDILHAEDETALIAPEIENIFHSEVLTKLRPEDKICVECINTPNGLVQTDELYEGALKKYWPTYAATHRPILYGADPRQRVGFEKYHEIDALQGAMLKILDEHIRVTTLPSTIDEAMQWVREGRFEIEFTKPFNRVAIKLADQIYRLEKTWMKNYHDLATRLARSGGRVYIIAGLIHIIDLHMKYGWPMMWLTKHATSWISPENVYRSGMNYTHFTDRIRRMKP